MYVRLSLLLSLVASAVVCVVAYPTLSPFWAPLLFVGGFVGFQLLFALYLILSTLLISKKEPEHPSPYAQLSCLFALDWFLALFNIHVHVVGDKALPKEPVVLVSNHRSFLDPVCIYTALPKRRMAFVAKASVRRYPVVGAHTLRAGFLFIERDKPLQGLRVMNRAARFVKEDGIDYGIFPEGTRSRDGSLLPYKSGAFLAAKKAGAPVAIFTLHGTHGAFRALPILPAHVYLRLEEIIPADRVQEMTPDELAEYSHAVTEKALSERPLPVKKKK
ncbi:MAG: 1-acyl-sn-glycerol-3-phosphate acyltransferase [Clostridia bacterium]|nr:1-acyl-sn-glycerol-3-phosphate acyltransferase [Clostridia bacterium]